MSGSASRGRSAPNFSIKTIWGLAKSPELKLNEDELYAVVNRETGKDSLRKLSQEEINQVCQALWKLKDGTSGSTGRKGMATKRQLTFIDDLEKDLGWADNPKRLRAFMLKYYNRSSVQWLTRKEASNLIESLKKVRDKEALKASKEDNHAGSNSKIYT